MLKHEMWPGAVPCNKRSCPGPKTTKQSKEGNKLGRWHASDQELDTQAANPHAMEGHRTATDACRTSTPEGGAKGSTLNTAKLTQALGSASNKM